VVCTTALQQLVRLFVREAYNLQHLLERIWNKTVSIQKDWQRFKDYALVPRNVADQQEPITTKSIAGVLVKKLECKVVFFRLVGALVNITLCD